MDRQFHGACTSRISRPRRSKANPTLATIPTRCSKWTHNIGRIMDAIRAEAPDTIVIITADNGAWQDAWPDAGTTPFRGEKGSRFEGGFRVPGIMWCARHIPAGCPRRNDVAHGRVAHDRHDGRAHPPPHGAWKDNNGKGIYFDGIDNTAYVTGKAKHSARKTWIYIDGENFQGARADMRRWTDGDIHMAWKMLFTSKDTWLGPSLDLGAIGSTTTSPWTPTRNTT